MSKSLELRPVLLGDYVYEKVRLRLGSYAMGGGLSVHLDCDEEGLWEPLATLTVNVPEDPRPGPLVWARDSEENAGIIDALAAQGLIEATGRTRPSGFIEMHEVKLLPPVLDLASE